MTPILTAALYKFVALPDFAELRDPLLACCEAHQIQGTILLAEEGINGTIAGVPDQIYAVLAYLRQDPRFADLEHKESYADRHPFHRMKVRLKKEIVTMGVPGLNPTEMAGQYVEPQNWNELINDPNVVVIDARNDYEVAIGSFQGAINPNTKSFSELPDWLLEQEALNATTDINNKPKVAMFCTGGIRCEKSTAFLRSQGFDEVYHLKGGILKYLETIPEAESLWEGECFVFDERVTVVHGLTPGTYDLCRACRQPVSPADKTSEFYRLGVSCPNCYGHRSADQQVRLAERQRQVELAKQRNQLHVGARYPTPVKSEASPKTPPILYSFRRCPFAMRARMALRISGITCELREVVLNDKPEALLEASPKGTVPVLVTSDRVLDESLDIMIWALEQNDPEGWLDADRADMLTLIQSCDREFKHHLDRYKYAHRYPENDVLEHRSAGALYLEQLNDRLAKTGYLLGDKASLADRAIVPFVRQFSIADVDWFNAQPWPYLQAWLTDWVESPLYADIMEKYEPWQPVTKCCGSSIGPGVRFPSDRS
jgi:UPF0176 protein